MANGATRLQPHTMLMGQAAGAIAALAVQNKVRPRAVDPVAVQKVLLDAGCILTIEPPRDVQRGTPEWTAKPLEVLHDGRTTPPATK
jgi:hypothetical protein